MTRNPIQEVFLLRVLAHFALGLVAGLLLLMFANLILFALAVFRGWTGSLSLGPFMVVEAFSEGRNAGLVWGSGSLILVLIVGVLNTLLAEGIRWLGR